MGSRNRAKASQESVTESENGGETRYTGDVKQGARYRGHKEAKGRKEAQPAIGGQRGVQSASVQPLGAPVGAHPWHVGTLKAHAGRITGLDMSFNGKYIITVAEDRTCLFWSTKELAEKSHKFVLNFLQYSVSSFAPVSCHTRLGFHIFTFSSNFMHTLCTLNTILRSSIGMGRSRKGVVRLTYFRLSVSIPFLCCNELSSWCPVALQVSHVWVLLSDPF